LKGIANNRANLWINPGGLQKNGFMKDFLKKVRLKAAVLKKSGLFCGILY